MGSARPNGPGEPYCIEITNDAVLPVIHTPARTWCVVEELAREQRSGSISGDALMSVRKIRPGVSRRINGRVA